LDIWNLHDPFNLNSNAFGIRAQDFFQIFDHDSNMVHFLKKRGHFFSTLLSMDEAKKVECNFGEDEDHD
jgi:hypothetical protein